MAAKMKTVHAPRSSGGAKLVVAVDPLAVPRGHRHLPRGGVHGSGKYPGRARSKQQWQRQLASGQEGRRSRHW